MPTSLTTHRYFHLDGVTATMLLPLSIFWDRGLHRYWRGHGVFATGIGVIYGRDSFMFGYMGTSNRGRIWGLGFKHNHNDCLRFADLTWVLLFSCLDGMDIGYIYPAKAKLTFNGIDMKFRPLLFRARKKQETSCGVSMIILCIKLPIKRPLAFTHVS